MPRKPPDKCPVELQARLSEINSAPAKARDWKNLKELLTGIAGHFERQNGDPAARADFEDDSEMEELMIEAYTEFVVAHVPDRFRGFALGLAEMAAAAGSDEIGRELDWIKSERAALHNMIRTAQDNHGGGMFSAPIRKFLYIENGILKTLERAHAVEIVLELKIKIDRLDICDICDKVYWRKYGGSSRRSETCGDKKCGYQRANLRRKTIKTGER